MVHPQPRWARTTPQVLFLDGLYYRIIDGFIHFRDSCFAIGSSPLVHVSLSPLPFERFLASSQGRFECRTFGVRWFCREAAGGITALTSLLVPLYWSTYSGACSQHASFVSSSPPPPPASLDAYGTVPAIYGVARTPRPALIVLPRAR